MTSHGCHAHHCPCYRNSQSSDPTICHAWHPLSLMRHTWIEHGSACSANSRAFQANKNRPCLTRVLMPVGGGDSGVAAFQLCSYNSHMMSRIKSSSHVDDPETHCSPDCMPYMSPPSPLLS